LPEALWLRWVTRFWVLEVFTFLVKLLYRLTSMSTSPRPQLHPPQSAEPTAMPTPNDRAAVANVAAA
jgi:hypothetical protein